MTQIECWLAAVKENSKKLSKVIETGDSQYTMFIADVGSRGISVGLRGKRKEQGRGSDDDEFGFWNSYGEIWLSLPVAREFAYWLLNVSNPTGADAQTPYA